MSKNRRRAGAIGLLMAVAAAAGALWLHTSSAGSGGPDIELLVGNVNQQNIEGHIDYLSNTIGQRSAMAQPTPLQAAADYVEATMLGFGYAPTPDVVTYQGRTFPNVIAASEGTVCPERVFIVGAHYDTVSDSPGADDDTSGVAAVLEISRVLAGTPLPATVWFTGFTMEELGLIGSLHMAQEQSAAGKEIVGMMAMDMIGYTTADPGGDRITVIGNEASIRLLDSFDRARGTYVPNLPATVMVVPGNGETEPVTRGSDHSPFWDQGYQGFIATDFLMEYRNPYYHTSGDVLSTLDLAFATNVTKAMLATTADYLTYDGDGDTQPDACTGPLAATATPTPPVTATPTATPKDPGADTDGDTVPNGDDPDDDNDGCTDLEELGDDFALGGLRNPHNFWDFFDVPAGEGLTRDGSIASLDIFQVLGRFNATDAGPGSFDRDSHPLQTSPNPIIPGADRENYHPAYDRGAPVGPNAWDLGPADGSIAAPDIFAVLGQFGGSCG